MLAGEKSQGEEQEEGETKRSQELPKKAQRRPKALERSSLEIRWLHVWA
jgi:hypothetical protein